MSFVESIARKRDGLELPTEEIQAFVRGATNGELPDEQLAAMLMAICIRGACPRETQVLVESMRDSGELWRLGDEFPLAVDKHSTGGVGDTVSLIFAPLLVACDVPVVMMAGAGLGHTQGTLDKLGAIPGFATARNHNDARARLAACGVCFASQSESIAPADKKLYLLRDTTGTVPSLPLIVASIMSKKLAVGAHTLVLDIKRGAGAFCKDEDTAFKLAEALVGVAQRAGVRVSGVISDMEEPLGNCLGTANEVRASLDILGGGGDLRLREFSLELVCDALVLGGLTRETARTLLESKLTDGSALARWHTIVTAHGGNPDENKLPRAKSTIEVTASRSGFVASVSAETLGWVAVELGAGRRFQKDVVDFAAGLVVHLRTGQVVNEGEPLATIELGDRTVDLDALVGKVRGAFTLCEEPPPVRPLISARLGDLS